jgi:hypothetical protein
LECDSNPTLELCPDGSFIYSPGVDFPGSTSFEYRAIVDAETVQATVTLTACEGGPTVFICWKETAFLARLAALGYGYFREGFEASAWDVARSPVTAPAVISQGVAWETNHPAPPAGNGITTGAGPARTGQPSTCSSR